MSANVPFISHTDEIEKKKKKANNFEFLLAFRPFDCTARESTQKERIADEDPAGPENSVS